MDFNIDLDKLLEEIKTMPEDHPLKVMARKVVKQQKEDDKETVEEWADRLATQLSKLTD